MTLGLAASALAAMGGGTLVALTCFLYWFFTAPKAHAPSHSPPHSEADDDSDTGTPFLTRTLPSSQPVLLYPAPTMALSEKQEGKCFLPYFDAGGMTRSHGMLSSQG